MEYLPLYIPITFGVALLLGLGIFGKAAGYASPVVAVLVFLTIIQSALGLAGFYNDAGSLTARFPLLIMPTLVFLFSMFFYRKGRAVIDGLDIRLLTLVHVVRIGVEIVLFWLFLHKGVPKAMTFDGRNFDVLSGLTAPLIYYFGFVRSSLPRRVLVAWNIICILLLLNVVSMAFLSLPGRYQHFNFGQPNIAVGYFPFLLLPAILVPLVLFAHAAAIRQLILQHNIDKKK